MHLSADEHKQIQNQSDATVSNSLADTCITIFQKHRAKQALAVKDETDSQGKQKVKQFELESESNPDGVSEG